MYGGRLRVDSEAWFFFTIEACQLFFFGWSLGNKTTSLDTCTLVLVTGFGRFGCSWLAAGWSTQAQDTI